MYRGGPSNRDQKSATTEKVSTAMQKLLAKKQPKPNPKIKTKTSIDYPFPGSHLYKFRTEQFSYYYRFPGYSGNSSG